MTSTIVYVKSCKIQVIWVLGMYVYIYNMTTSGGHKFMLVGADINLIGTVWSAANRMRKLILRGQCGMVRLHPVLN